MTHPFACRWQLRTFGFASAALFLALAGFFWTDAAFQNSRLSQAVICACGLLLTVIYFAGLRLVRKAKMREIALFAALFALLGFVTLPFDSTDVFYYMAQGWSQSHYQANPYTQVLRDIPNVMDDPMIGSSWMQFNANPWLDEPLPYGFAFAWISHALASLGAGSFWRTLALFELVNLAIHAAVTWVLWKAASRIPNADPKLIVYLYAWNPLVVLQFLANAHNDIIMGALIVLAFYLLIAKRPLWILPVIVTAGLVKFVALALAPFAMLLIARRHGWHRALAGMLLAGAIAAAVSLPYLWEARLFRLDDIVVQMTESKGSLHAFLLLGARSISKVSPAAAVYLSSFSALTKMALWSVVAWFLARQWKRTWSTQEESTTDICSHWTAILFAIVFVGSSQFYAWYIGMLLPLAMLGAGSSRLTDAVVILSGTHMLSFTFVQRKTFGYFILSTAIPLAILVYRWRKTRAEPVLASYLSTSPATTVT